MKLLIVIVNYKGYRLTADCLETLVPEIGTVPGARVGLCDNGSGNGDAEKLAALIAQRGWAGWCTLTAIDPNLGFTGGNNAVIRPYFAAAARERLDGLEAGRADPGDLLVTARLTPPDYVLLLNNDTLLRPGALKHLVAFMDAHPDAGCAGSRLEDPDGTPQVSAFRFFNLVNEFETQARMGPIHRLFRRHAVALPIPTADAPVDWVAGASLIIRRAVIERIGALDDAFYTYFDDIDYCRSARRAGWPTWYVPASRVVHLVGQTTGITNAAGKTAKAKRRPAYWFQARRRYWLKHHGKLVAALADLSFIAGLFFCRVRTTLTPHTIPLPQRFLRDFIAQSVFFKGFRTPHVVNPAVDAPNPLNPTVVGIGAAEADHA